MQRWLQDSQQSVSLTDVLHASVLWMADRECSVNMHGDMRTVMLSSPSHDPFQPTGLCGTLQGTRR